MPFSDMKAHEFFQLKISPFQAWLRLILAGDASPVTLVGLAMKYNYCCYVLAPMWITHLPLACSLQGCHGVICDNLAGND